MINMYSYVIEKIRKWLLKLSPGQRNLPVYPIDNIILTPNEVYYHVSHYTNIGMKIIRREMGLGHQRPEEAIPLFLMRMAKEYPTIVIGHLFGKPITASEALLEIQKKTPFGMAIYRALYRKIGEVLGKL